MKIFRTYKFRLRPNAEQEAILNQVCASVRVAYNAANEQRLLYQRKRGTDYHGRDSQFHKFSQCRQLSTREMKKDADLAWMAEYTHSRAFENAMEDLQKAWDTVLSARSKGKSSHDPGFRNAHDDNSFRLTVWKKSSRGDSPTIVFGRHFVRLPKIGYVKYIKHKKMRGEFKTATISREGKRWYICVSAEIEVAAPKPRDSNYVGIDLGTVTPIALSDGTEVPFVKVSKKDKKRTKDLQRKLSRAKKGSNRRKVLRARLSEATRKDTARKRAQLHTITTGLVREFTHIGRENLSVKTMTKSAKTRRREGSRTASNAIQAAYNRAFLEVPKYAFNHMLEYKAPQYGTEVVTVDPAYTSQTCSACGHVSKESRVSQDKYICTNCGHAEHADVNAAKNILKAAFPNSSLNSIGVRSEPRKTPSENRKRQKPSVQTSATSKSMVSLTEGRIGSHSQISKVEKYSTNLGVSHSIGCN